MPAHRTKAYIYLLLVALIWGMASPIIKFTLNGIDPGPFLMYRFLVSGTVAVIYLLITGQYKKVIRNAHLPTLLIYSVISTTIALGALFWGMDRIAVLEANVVSSIIPLLIVIGGAIVFKDRVTRQEKAGALLAFAGTCIALIIPVISGFKDISHWIGIIFMFVYLFGDIASALTAKWLLRKKVNPSFMTNFAFLIGFITISPVVLSQTPSSELVNSLVNLPYEYHLGVWYMALISGTLAYYLRNTAQKSIEVSEAGLFSYLVPLFSAPIAIVWLGEKLTISLLVGATLIIAGVVVAETKGKARKRFEEHVRKVLHRK